MATLEAQPLAYNRDLQEDKEPVFDSVAQLSWCCRRWPGCRDAALRRRPDGRAGPGRVHAGHRRRRMAGARGVPFRVAHEVAGAACAPPRSGVGLDELTDDELASISADLTPEVRDVLTVEGSVRARNARGGTAPEQVAAQLTSVRETVTGLRQRLRR